MKTKRGGITTCGYMHGWLVHRLGKGSERACTNFAASACSVSVAVIATAAAAVTAAVAAVAAAAAAAATTAAASAAAAVSRSPEAVGVSSSSFHGSFWCCGFLSCALKSCARMHAGQEYSEVEAREGLWTRR